jgi:7-keto-8-aminopelargonate synthetase-like enzyme
VPLILGDEPLAVAAAQALREAGLLVPAIRYPTVARGAARLRITLSAAHTADDVQRLLEALAPLLRDAPVPPSPHP